MLQRFLRIGETSTASRPELFNALVIKNLPGASLRVIWATSEIRGSARSALVTKANRRAVHRDGKPRRKRAPHWASAFSTSAIMSASQALVTGRHTGSGSPVYLRPACRWPSATIQWPRLLIMERFAAQAFSHEVFPHWLADKHQTLHWITSAIEQVVNCIISPSVRATRLVFHGGNIAGQHRHRAGKAVKKTTSTAPDLRRYRRR